MQYAYILIRNENCFPDWSSHSLEHTLSFSPLIFSWKENTENSELYYAIYAMYEARTDLSVHEMKFAFQIDLPSCQVTSFSLEHTLSFSPLIFSWKENKLSPNFFLPLGDPHNLFYNLFQCQLQIAAWSLASNRKSDQNADFLFKIFLLWSEIVGWLFDIQ